MKGSSLPIDTIVLLILAVLVLGAVIFFFFGTFTPGADSIKAQQTIASVCGELATQYGCDVSQFTSEKGSGTDKTFYNAQISKLTDLNKACQTNKVSSCTGSGNAGQPCVNICCQTFCPSTTTTTK